MRRKIINSIVGLLFVLFAVVQLNDPDPLKWVIIYGFVAAGPESVDRELYGKREIEAFVTRRLAQGRTGPVRQDGG